jgi:hypothetical protein
MTKFFIFKLLIKNIVIKQELLLPLVLLLLILMNYGCSPDKSHAGSYYFTLMHIGSGVIKLEKLLQGKFSS